MVEYVRSFYLFNTICNKNKYLNLCSYLSVLFCLLWWCDGDSVILDIFADVDTLGNCLTLAWVVGSTPKMISVEQLSSSGYSVSKWTWSRWCAIKIIYLLFKAKLVWVGSQMVKCLPQYLQLIGRAMMYRHIPDR